MTFSRKLVISASLACLVLAAMPALAQDVVQCPPTRPHHTHHVTHSAKHRGWSKHKTRAFASQGDAIVRIAQQHLANLGYYNGKIDGKMGPATKAAIKQFQREQGMKADGVLGSKTRRALESADHLVMITPTVVGAQTQGAIVQPYVPDPNPEVNQDYQLPLPVGSKNLFSRYAQISATEAKAGFGKSYNVTMNGQPVLSADGQPSVIGMSMTYDLGEEDAIIFTTYTPDSTCLYQTHVLALSTSGSRMLDVQNCTRDFEAHADHHSLYIRFPEADDNRDIGATWRLDGMNLERL